MGQGLGKAQHSILDVLGAADDYALTVPDIAERIDRSERQVRAAVRALESRSLVVVTKGYTGWNGRGEFGPYISYVEFDRKDKEFTPPPGIENLRRVEYDGPTGRIAEYRGWIRRGMPAHGLWVWLPENRDEWRKMDFEHSNKIRAAFGNKTLTWDEYLACEEFAQWKYPKK